MSPAPGGGGVEALERRWRRNDRDAWYPFPVVDLPGGLDPRKFRQAAVAAIRSYNAVAVVGAGISAARYPMTSGLGPPIAWMT